MVVWDVVTMGEGVVARQGLSWSVGGMRRWRARGRLVALVVGVAVMAWAAWRPEARALLEYAAAQRALAAWGWGAPVVFGGVFAASVVAAVPATPLTLLGASLFEPLVAYVVLLGGAMLGAVVSFGLGRWLGRGFVEEVCAEAAGEGWRARLAGWDARVSARGLWVVVAVRLSHVPYPLASYGLALTGVRFGDYVLGTLLGSAPLVFVFVFLGDALRRAWASGAWAGLLSWRLVVAAGLLGASMVAPWAIGRWRLRLRGDGGSDGECD